MLRTPRSTLFPYTTLFRSLMARGSGDAGRDHAVAERVSVPPHQDFLLEPHRHRSAPRAAGAKTQDRKSTRLNSSHVEISYAVFCLKKKKIQRILKNPILTP